jgi:hypothetical protein
VPSTSLSVSSFTRPADGLSVGSSTLCKASQEADPDLRELLSTLTPTARDALRRVLVRDQANRDAISSRRPSSDDRPAVLHARSDQRYESVLEERREAWSAKVGHARIGVHRALDPC